MSVHGSRVGIDTHRRSRGGALNRSVIRGASVLDGTGAPSQTADVVVSGRRFVDIVPPGTPVDGNVLDASGLTLCPGFIDTHSHVDLAILEDPHVLPKTRQGITTEIIGQSGISVAPLRDQDVIDVRDQIAGFAGSPPVDWAWRSVGEYLETVAKSQPSPNVSFLAPHGSLRRWSMGMENRAPTQEELDCMVDALDDAFAEGAAGLSTGLAYAPACYAEKGELLALAKVAARRGRIFTAHVRSEGDRVLEAVEEFLSIGRATGCALHLSHLKIAGKLNWDRLDDLLDLLDQGRQEGLRITADQYPYDAASTTLAALLPPWSLEGGTTAALHRIADPDICARIRSDICEKDPRGWDNYWRWSGGDGIVIADIPSGRQSDLVGLTLSAAGEERGMDPLDLVFDLLLSERLGVSMISFSQNEANVERILRQPYVCICTNGLLGGHPHPRTYGSFPRILSRFVRERRVLDLPDAIRRMTHLPARAFGFKHRGQIAPGYFADAVLFDPKTIADRATYSDPWQPAEGIAAVLVNGEVIIKNGEPTGNRPGRVLGQIRHSGVSPS